MLSNAMEYVPEPQVELVRARLRVFAAAKHDGWPFALYARRHPWSGLLGSRAIGVITLEESLALTHAMIAALGVDAVWLESTLRPVRLQALCEQREVAHEPCPGLYVRKPDDAKILDVISPRDVPALGILALAVERPPGWPR